MVEVWARSVRRQVSVHDKTLTFFVTKQMDAKYLVQGSQQILTNGQTTDVPLEGTTSDPVSDTPQTAELLRRPADRRSAAVTITARSAASDTDTDRRRRS